MEEYKTLFLDRIKQDAIDGWISNEILPSITSAQGILESDWGRSPLAVKYNNLFGIKNSDDWEGESIILQTTEYVDGVKVFEDCEFRIYASWEASLESHAQLFTSTPYRTKLYSKIVGETNYKKVAQALQGTYATDIAYANKLINIIELYNLSELDKEVLGKEFDMNNYNYILLLDAGHGGTDGGASGNGISEKEWNLEVSKKTATLLRALGYKVVETRTDDSTVSLDARTKRANAEKADILLSIHVNAVTSPDANGYEDFIHDTLSGENDKKFQDCIHAEMVKVLSEHGMYNRGKKSANYHMLRESTMPAVLIETGFCTSPYDASKLKLADYKDDVARAIVNGINAYFGNSTIEKSGETTVVTPVEEVAETVAEVKGSSYTVKKGDTLYSIAKENGLTVDNLLLWNSISDASKLSIGTVLTIQNGTTSYTVQKGDTMYSIASKFNTSVGALVETNMVLDPSKIHVGDVLKVNGTEKITAPPAPVAGLTENDKVVTVEAGDSIEAIAQENNTTIEDITTSNGIIDVGRIAVGENLHIHVNITIEQDSLDEPSVEVIVEETTTKPKRKTKKAQVEIIFEPEDFKEVETATE